MRKAKVGDRVKCGLWSGVIRNVLPREGRRIPARATVRWDAGGFNDIPLMRLTRVRAR